jgi:hypothetical protein
LKIEIRSLVAVGSKCAAAGSERELSASAETKFGGLADRGVGRVETDHAKPP